MKNKGPHKILARVWAVVFVIVLLIAVILLFLMNTARTPASNMSFVEDEGRLVTGMLPPPAPAPGGPRIGTMTVFDAGKKVLTYMYRDQLPAGADPRYVRSSYIHPLFSLEGAELTDDFPRDHPHHHGIFWTWPSVRVRGVATQTWHPAEPSLRQHFVKWIKREVTDAGARLVVENTWKLGEAEDVAEETVSLFVHGASRFGRAIDVELVLRPVGGPIELRGAAEDDKGYGGLTFRGRGGRRGVRLFEGAAMTTDEGPLASDSTGKPFRWADLSTPSDGGVAVFVSPDHPGYPLDWLVRNSYAGVINPCWPGLAGATVPSDTPVTLRYRIYVHRGDAAAGRVKEAFEAYLAGRDDF